MNDAYALAWSKAAREAEDAIDLSRFPLALRIRMEMRMPIGVEIAVQMAVVDRDAPAGKRDRMTVGTSEMVSLEQLEELADFVARGDITRGSDARKHALVDRALLFVRSIVLHELDECTQVNGVRIYDPHIPERRRFDAHP
jgi:hypothetical protein